MVATLAFGLCAAHACDDRVVGFVTHHAGKEIVEAAQKVVGQVIKGEAIVWPAPLSDLKPVRGYRDRVNLVAVLKEDGKREFGLYVILPESSYLPISDGEWTFTGTGSVLIYERETGHNQRPEGTSAKAPPSKPSQGAAVPHP